MGTSLPNARAPEKLTRPCPACGKDIIPTRDDKGRAVILEWCRPGKGTHTITAGLFPGIEPTATLSAGKFYRIHACPTSVERSHSAASFEGKKAVSDVGGPSISYRPKGSVNSRGRK